MTSTISLSCGFMKVPNSEEAMVIQDMAWYSFSQRTSRVEEARDWARACHVTASGPKMMSSISLSRFIPMEIVVDLDTIPGGATRMI